MAVPLVAQEPTAPPAQSGQAPATVIPPQKPPFPNRVNDVLPSWLRVRGEFRERVEAVRNLDFTADRDDVYSLSRVRFNATAASRHVAATVQVQDARVAQKTVGPTGTPFRATFDLRQGFVVFGAASNPVTMRVGRQELAYGDQRLIGHVNWLNAGRTFDAVRMSIRSTQLHLDVFAGSVVRILDGELDRSGAGKRLAGAHVSTGRVLPQGTFEPYVIWRRDQGLRTEAGVPGTLAQVTSGVRLLGTLPASLDYNVEMARQWGSLGPDSVSAWAGHWQLRRTFTGRWMLHATGEYNYATGDENATDGVRGTFDQLYPTPHDKLGLADQVSWKNIHHLRAGIDVAPWRVTPIAVNYHSFWLAETTDALYVASGAVLARVPGGARSAWVGQEIDVQMTRPLTPQVALAVGYSHLFAGSFLAAATPGQSFGGSFVMLTYTFLAEK